MLFVCLFIYFWPGGVSVISTFCSISNEYMDKMVWEQRRTVWFSGEHHLRRCVCSSVVRCPAVTFINAVQMSLAGSAFQVNSLRGWRKGTKTCTRVFKFYSAEQERSEWKVQEGCDGFPPPPPPFLSTRYWTAASGDLLNQIMASLADN